MGRRRFTVVSVVVFAALMAVPTLDHAMSLAPFFGDYPDADERFTANVQLAAFFAVACPVALALPAWVMRRGDPWVWSAVIVGLLVGGTVLVAALLVGRAYVLTGPAPILMLAAYVGGVIVLVRWMPGLE